MTGTNCLNCGEIVISGQQYCSGCGQSVKVHRVSFHYFFHELVHGVTHADIGILYTIKMLARQPGLVAREYLAGKRKKYFPPVSFYLVLIGLFVFALGAFHTFEQSNNFAEWRAGIRKMPDSQKVVRERRLQKIDRAETAMAFMTKKSNLVSLLAATPLTAFIFFLFYYRRGYNFIEHLVVNFYFAGFGALIFIFIVAPLINLVGTQTFYLFAISAFLVAEALYRSYAYYGFINRGGLKGYLYALLASVTAVSSWIAISTSAISYYIEHGLPEFF